MNFKVKSPERATYQIDGFSKILKSMLGLFFLFVGLLNIYFAGGEKALPLWVIGLITTLAWHLSFAGYKVDFDLGRRIITQKASSIYPIFHRQYRLQDVKGFRAVSLGARSRPYAVVMMCRDGKQLTLATTKHRKIANHLVKEIAGFTKLPYSVDLD